MPLLFLERKHLKTHENGVTPWLNSNYMFLHIPKSAGTSINKSLKMPDIGHVTYRGLLRKDFSFSRKKYYFCIHRNPIDRLRSTYYYSKKITEKGYSMLSAMSEYKCYNEFVDEYINEKRVANHYFLRSTYDFLKDCPAEETYIINFEKLKNRDTRDDILILLKKITGEEIELPHLNKSSINNGDESNLTTSSLNKIRKIYQHDINIDQHLKNKNFITLKELLSKDELSF